MAYDTLLYETKDRVARVTLNRPEKRNAVDTRMFEEIGLVFDEIADDPDVRAFVLTGQGDHFCSGADLSAIEEVPRGPADMRTRMGWIHQILAKIIYNPKPGVAAVRGYAAGGGANLALACDLVVMHEEARFAELFVKRGLVMDMSGTFTLPRTVGLHRAKELALLGDTIDAKTAFDMGIANRVESEGQFEATVEDLSSRLAAGPPIALSMMKKAINDSFSKTFDEVLDEEGFNQSILFSTQDLQEAIKAFFEKREPNFTGE